jgi:hypothetical protein
MKKVPQVFEMRFLRHIDEATLLRKKQNRDRQVKLNWAGGRRLIIEKAIFKVYKANIKAQMKRENLNKRRTD